MLDVSEERLNIAKKNLAKFAGRTNFICADAYEYLSKGVKYDIIISAWTIHNFNKEDRLKMLKAIFENLEAGGTFVLLDKIYESSSDMSLLEKQNNRYKKYLNKEVAEAIIAHEIEDASDEYRIDEYEFLDTLNSIGFIDVQIIDRVERDVVLIARK